MSPAVVYPTEAEDTADKGVFYMQLQYLGHSCFKLSSGDYSIVVDPYENGSVPGLRDLDVTANLCLCSHGHGDHHGDSCVTIAESFVRSPFGIEAVESWHDADCGRKRGTNSIHIFHGEGMKVIHLGDMGCRPENWQMELLREADAVMAPAGGYYTAEPSVVSEVLKEINPRIVIPMHYRTAVSGFPVLKTCEEFLSYCSGVVRYETDTLVLNRNSKPHTAVLKQWACR